MVGLTDPVHSINSKSLEILLFFAQMSMVLKLVEISGLSEKILGMDGIFLILSYQLMRFQNFLVPLQNSIFHKILP